MKEFKVSYPTPTGPFPTREVTAVAEYFEVEGEWLVFFDAKTRRIAAVSAHNVISVVRHD